MSPKLTNAPSAVPEGAFRRFGGNVCNVSILYLKIHQGDEQIRPVLFPCMSGCRLPIRWPLPSALMSGVMLKVAVYDATPDPKLVIAMGDCGADGGEFGISYASCGAVANVIHVDVDVLRVRCSFSRALQSCFVDAESPLWGELLSYRFTLLLLPRLHTEPPKHFCVVTAG